MKVNCDFCGKEIEKMPCHVKRNKHNFCNKKCHGSWKSKNLIGKNHPSWKGGRYKLKTGYVLVYKPGHPRQNNWGYVYEHILVAEKKFNKSTVGCHVHHLNGIRSDNRPENLDLVKPKDHESNTVKKILQKRIRELEEQLSSLREYN